MTLHPQATASAGFIHPSIDASRPMMGQRAGLMRVGYQVAPHGVYRPDYGMMIPGPPCSYGYPGPPHPTLVQGMGGASGGYQPQGLYPMSQPFHVAAPAPTAVPPMWQVTPMATTTVTTATATVVTSALSCNRMVATGMAPRVACFEVPGCQAGIVPRMTSNEAPLFRQPAPVAPGVSAVNTRGQVEGLQPNTNVHYRPAISRDGTAGQVATGAGVPGMIAYTDPPTVQRLPNPQVQGHGVPSHAGGGMGQQSNDQLIPLLQELLARGCSSVPNAVAGSSRPAAYSHADALPGAMTPRRSPHGRHPDAQVTGDRVHPFSLLGSGRSVDALPHTVRRGAVPQPPSTPVSTVSRAGPSRQVASNAAGPSRAAANAMSPASTESSSRRSVLYSDISDADSDGERSESGGSTSSSSQPQSQPTEPKVDKEPPLPVCTPDVLYRIAKSLGLACEGEPEEQGQLDLWFAIAPPGEIQAYALPTDVGVLWSRSARARQTLGKWRVPSFFRSLRTSREPYDSYLRTPVIDEDVVKYLPKSRNHPATFSPYWEDELRALDTAVSTTTRLGAFAMTTCHDLRGRISKALPADRSLAEDATLLAALVTRQTETSMAMLRRLSFLRRENVLHSLKASFSPDFAKELGKTDPEKRDVLFGGTFCASLTTSADQVESVQAVKEAQAKVSSSKKKSAKSHRRGRRAAARATSSKTPAVSSKDTPKPYSNPKTPKGKSGAKRKAPPATAVKSKRSKQGKPHRS